MRVIDRQEAKNLIKSAVKEARDKQSKFHSETLMRTLAQLSTVCGTTAFSKDLDILKLEDFNEYLQLVGRMAEKLMLHTKGRIESATIIEDVYFDYENHTIHCLLNKYESMNAACTHFDLDRGQDFIRCIATDHGTGNRVTFNNPDAMVRFLEKHHTPIDFSSFENFLSFWGTEVSITWIISKDVDALRGLQEAGLGTEILSKTSTTLGVLSVVIDAVQMAKSIDSGSIGGMIDHGTDIVIGAISLFGVEGALISIGLSYTKKGVIGTYRLAQYLAEIKTELEKQFVNRISQAAFGINFKR